MELLKPGIIKLNMEGNKCVIKIVVGQDNCESRTKEIIKHLIFHSNGNIMIL